MATSRSSSAHTGHDMAVARIRRILAVLAAVAGVYLSVVLILAWQAASWGIDPPPETYPWHLADYRSLTPQSIAFHSQTGSTIVGRFFPAQNHAAIILSPGYGADQNEMLPWADFLHQADFSVLTYDPRGRGQSTGSMTSGVLETRDLISAVTYLEGRRDVAKQEIGVLGVSQGAAESILAAAQDQRIKAVVADSAFANERDTFNPSLWDVLRHPKDPDSLLAMVLIQVRTGIDFSTIRPVDKIGLISPRPVFIIQGTNDSVVPPHDAAENYAAAKEPKELWWVRGAGHVEALSRTGSTYRERVIAFFQKAFHLERVTPP